MPVLGVSADPPAIQDKFKQKYNLPFPLLCDVERKVAKDYGVLREKNLYGNKVVGIDRTTFVIGGDGIIKKIFTKVHVEGHTEEVLAALKSEPRP